MVSEPYGSSTATMGAPPLNQHRTEMLEQGFGDLSFSISEQITAAVNSAFQKMQQTLIDHISLSIDQAFQRFETRIARSLEQQDVSMNTSKDDQLKSQEERRGGHPSLRCEILANPAPPHLFHLTEPPPSMPSDIYITEFSAQQVFEVIPERNSVLIDETFKTTLTTVGNWFVGHCSTLTSKGKVVKVFDGSWERGFIFAENDGSVYNLPGNEIISVNELFGKMCRADKQIAVGELPLLILKMEERVEFFVDMAETSFTIPVCVTDPLQRIARIINICSRLNVMPLLRQPRAFTIADRLDKGYVTAGNKNIHTFDPGGATIDVSLSTTQQGISELVSKIYIMSIISDEMLNKDVIIRNLMAYGFYKSGDFELGLQYFRELTEWPVFSVNSLPSGLVHYGRNVTELVACLERNELVLVSALTLVSKIIVAKYAVALSCRDKQRVLYTSRLTAWDSQRYREFSHEFVEVGMIEHNDGISVLATIKLFHEITLSVTDMHQQAYECIKPMFLSRINTGNAELFTTVLGRFNLPFYIANRASFCTKVEPAPCLFTSGSPLGPFLFVDSFQLHVELVFLCLHSHELLTVVSYGFNLSFFKVVSDLTGHDAIEKQLDYTTEWVAFMQVNQSLLDYFPAFNICSKLIIFGVYTAGRRVILWCRTDNVLVFDPGVVTEFILQSILKNFLVNKGLETAKAEPPIESLAQRLDLSVAALKPSPLSPTRDKSILAIVDRRLLAWYWNILLLVFDPGTQGCYKQVPGDCDYLKCSQILSFLRTRMFLRGMECNGPGIYMGLLLVLQLGRIIVSS